MKALIQDSVLATDLDANFFNILNLAAMLPPPPNLVLSNDPRLSDARTPIDGSVTDSSVSATAGIQQSKLLLNGAIPTAWLGTTATTAAKGSLAEYLSNKGQPNGYAALDSSGKVPIAQIPTAVGTGTVTSVGLSLPATFTVSGSPVTGSGVLAASWAAVSDQSWFGNKSGAPAAPQFYTSPLPASLIPPLDASVFATGTIPAARLPIAQGLGGLHSSGAAPDPGAGGGGAMATDYLARDMTYKAFPLIGPAYQPTIDTPVITAGGNITGPVNVTFATVAPGVTFFYSLTSSSSGFSELTSSGFVSVPNGGGKVWVYAAKTGYNNSAIANYVNPNP